MKDTLRSSRYLNLGTFRRSGEVVRTPVWFAELDGALYVFSAGEAGKVKRLRNFSDVEIAACDVRGRVHGDWFEAQAYLIDDEQECDAAYRALRHKYGLQMRLLDLGSWLSGRIDQRQLIRIEY